MLPENHGPLGRVPRSPSVHLLCQWLRPFQHRDQCPGTQFFYGEWKENVLGLVQGVPVSYHLSFMLFFKLFAFGSPHRREPTQYLTF